MQESRVQSLGGEDTLEKADFLPTGEVLRRQAASCFMGEGARVFAGLRKEMLGNGRNLYCGEADSKGGTVK